MKRQSYITVIILALCVQTAFAIDSTVKVKTVRFYFPDAVSYTDTTPIEKIEIVYSTSKDTLAEFPRHFNTFITIRGRFPLGGDLYAIWPSVEGGNRRALVRNVQKLPLVIPKDADVVINPDQLINVIISCPEAADHNEVGSLAFYMDPNDKVSLFSTALWHYKTGRRDATPSKKPQKILMDPNNLKLSIKPGTYTVKALIPSERKGVTLQTLTIDPIPGKKYEIKLGAMLSKKASTHEPQP